MSELEPKRVRADAAQRAKRAAELRVQGFTWRQIADDIGFAEEGSVRRLVQRYYSQVPDPDRSEAKKLMRDRAEHLWAQSVVDVAEQKPGALRGAIALLQRQSALDGLDEPARMQVSPDVEQFERVVQLLTAARRRELGYQDAPEGDVFADIEDDMVEVDVVE